VCTRTVLLPPGGELAAGAEANGWEPERGVDPCPHSRREGRVEQGLDVLPAPCPGQAGDRREPAEEGRAAVEVRSGRWPRALATPEASILGQE